MDIAPTVLKYLRPADPGGHRRQAAVVRRVAGAASCLLCARGAGRRADIARRVARPQPRRSGVAERLRGAAARSATLSPTSEQTLLVELRKLEIERADQGRGARAIERELETTQEQLAAATARADALRRRPNTQRPDVEARLVQLYKMGRAGYWRLLLDVDDLQRSAARTAPPRR